MAVTGPRHQPEIGDFIVEFVSIQVVYLVAVRYVSVMDIPDNPVRRIPIYHTVYGPLTGCVTGGHARSIPVLSSTVTHQTPFSIAYKTSYCCITFHTLFTCLLTQTSKVHQASQVIMIRLRQRVQRMSGSVELLCSQALAWYDTSSS